MKKHGDAQQTCPQPDDKSASLAAPMRLRCAAEVSRARRCGCIGNIYKAAKSARRHLSESNQEMTVHTHTHTLQVEQRGKHMQPEYVEQRGTFEQVLFSSFFQFWRSHSE